MTRSQLIHPFLANPKRAEKFPQEKQALLHMQHILMDRYWQLALERLRLVSLLLPLGQLQVVLMSQIMKQLQQVKMRHISRNMVEVQLTEHRP